MSGVLYETDDLFQIGMPAWCLSTVFALWCSYERPGIILQRLMIGWWSN